MIACVGGGSNAIGIFAAVPRRRRRRADRRRGRGRGDRDRPPRRAADRRRARAASCTARCSAIMQDEEGQILEAHSISAGLDYPGIGPRARLPARHRPRALRRGHRRAGARRVPRASRGWRASSRRSRPRTRSPGCSRSRATPATRPGLPAPAAATRTSPRCCAQRPRAMTARPATGASGSPRRSPAPRQARGADALPDGRLPDLEASRAIGEAYADGGADLVELGVPFSDPLADGPVIHAAGTRALRGRRDACRRARGRRARSPQRVPVVRDVLRQPRPRARRRALRRRARRRPGVSGLIVPDLPLEEAPALLEACDAAGVALVPLVAPTTPDERLARDRRAARAASSTRSR